MDDIIDPSDMRPRIIKALQVSATKRDDLPGKKHGIMPVSRGAIRSESIQAACELLPLQSDIIYGPVRSRRLGLSLGINLLPTGYKLCSFNCIYCQYGWTFKPTVRPTHQLKDLPRLSQVMAALKGALEELRRQGKTLNCVTFCGNGEPTLHPDLAEIIAGVKRVRDEYFPSAKLAILSNSSTVGREDVRKALRLLDLRIMKLDAGSEKIIRRINAPAPPFHLEEIISGLKQLGDLTLQSLFVQGRVNNTDPDSVAIWIEKVKEIHPTLVQGYSLARVPADRRIRKVDLPTLRRIAERVRREAGVEAEVY